MQQTTVEANQTTMHGQTYEQLIARLETRIAEMEAADQVRMEELERRVNQRGQIMEQRGAQLAGMEGMLRTLTELGEHQRHEQQHLAEQQRQSDEEQQRAAQLAEQRQLAEQQRLFEEQQRQEEKQRAAQLAEQQRLAEQQHQFEELQQQRQLE